MKEFEQYPVGGFAPGYYYCKCVNCKQEFLGDKRAVQCKPCTIEMVNTKFKETLEEVAKKLYPIDNTGSMFMPNKEEVKNIYRQEGFIKGAKHQAKQMYSEEVLFQAFRKGNDFATMPEHDLDTVKKDFNKWLKQFKNE